jgi:sporulation protein YlmC with PRC-barrel domain
MDQKTAAKAEVLRARDFLGWTVADASGSKLGTVSDLLLDRSGRVRFLAVKAGRHVLVPVTELEWGSENLVLPRWSGDDLKRLPAYDPDVSISAAYLDEMTRAHPRYYGLEQAPPRAPGEGQVVPMREAKDFRIAKDDPDVRKWNVFGADGERVGVVSEMLVDPAAMKIRYLDVDLADDLFTLKEDRHVLIPMEHAELRERGKDVWVKGLRAREVARLPAYTGGTADPYVTDLVDRAFSAT